jgi:hypothetical protein
MVASWATLLLPGLWGWLYGDVRVSTFIPSSPDGCLQFAFRLMVHTTHTYTYLQVSAEPGVTLTLASFKTQFCTGIVGILFKRIYILSLSQKRYNWVCWSD